MVFLLFTIHFVVNYDIETYTPTCFDYRGTIGIILKRNLISSISSFLYYFVISSTEKVNNKNEEANNHPFVHSFLKTTLHKNDDFDKDHKAK